jgi:hypothetical protein
VYKRLSNILLSRLIPYAEEIIGIISVDFDAIVRLLIVCSAFDKNMRKNGNTMQQCISSFIDFKRAYVSVRREVL